jgi:hypothetical protein
MVACSMDGNHKLTSLQFDTLRYNTEIIDRKFLITGLEEKSKIGNDDAIVKILGLQDKRSYAKAFFKVINYIIYYISLIPELYHFFDRKSFNAKLSKETSAYFC